MSKIILSILRLTNLILFKISKNKFIKINQINIYNQKSITILNIYLLKYHSKINMKTFNNKRLMNIRILIPAMEI